MGSLRPLSTTTTIIIHQISRTINFPYTMSLFRTAFPSLRSGASASLAGRRTFTTAFVARTDDPRVLDKDTHSGASVKADKHSKDPKTLQKEHTHSANRQSGTGKVTASPNDVPTDSEDSVHGEKHSKSPEQLQKEHSSH
ncbi:hypothetical protein PHBOTO_006110 [Pseudozyma hubeiensis]|nr:hypothetical protein PHBOTO_006110 [Pseudozyma hubeiensis]